MRWIDRRARRALCLSGALVASCGTLSAAQSVTARTANIDDGWTVPAGVLQFNFLHRFTATDPPARKVTSFPSFHFATGLPADVNLGLVYSTNSAVFPGIPNEYEVSLRRPFMRQADERPFDFSASGGYNAAAQSVDGEVTVARTFGRLKTLEVVRGFSSGYDTKRALYGFGGGATFRISDALSIGGDYFRLTNLHDDAIAAPAWGLSIATRIPYTPHSLSIQVSNTQTATMQGSSKGLKRQKMVGFEFTIPVTLARYFTQTGQPVPDESVPAPRRPLPPAMTSDSVTAPSAVAPVAVPPSSTPPAATPSPGAPLTAPSPAATSTAVERAPAAAPRAARAPITIRITNLAFRTPVLHVPAGTRIRWLNGDPLQHSVTSDAKIFDSGLIDAGKSFERLFDTPGTYTYHCTPHPFMKGTIIVDR